MSALPTEDGLPAELPAGNAAESYHREARRRGTYLLGVGAVVLLLSGVLLYESVGGTGGGVQVEPAALTVIVLLLGAYSVVGGYRARLPALATVAVSRTGVELRWATGAPTVRRWDDPRLRLELSDRRDLRPIGRGEFVSVLTVNGRRAGVSPEIVDAVVAAAKRYGVRVTPREYSGSWGQIVRYRIGPRPPS